MDLMNSESNKRLFSALAKITEPADIAAFLEDICTIKEVLDMAQRLDTAILLDKGFNYKDIETKVGVSTATISRVSKCLNYGSGGYRTALDTLSESEKNL